MDVLPCQVRECRTEILVSEEDPDSALSDLNDHLKTHGLDNEDAFHYWMASQLAVRPQVIHRCENEQHDDDRRGQDGRPPATVRMSWPDGRFVDAYACDSCMLWSIRVYVQDDFEDGARHPVLIESVESTATIPKRQED